MSKPKLSPWFSAQKQPPVNGGNYTMYQWRCKSDQTRPEPQLRKKWWIIGFSDCQKCEWRGLLK